MSRKQIVWIAVFVVLLASGCKEAPPAAAPTAAAVVSVRRGSLASTLTVAGQFQAYQQVDLHAKVSGYIRWIKVDIGDLVHNGEVLATLEVPELADQLNGSQAEVQHSQSEIVRAQSEVAAAKATYSALHAEYTRLAEAAKERPGLIAQQELDDAQSKDQQAEAQIGVAQAALESMQQQLGVSKADNHRFQTLTNYEQIVAPFNGRGDHALRGHGIADPGRHNLRHTVDAGGAGGAERPASPAHAGARGRRALHSPGRQSPGEGQRNRPQLYRNHRAFYAVTGYQHAHHADGGRRSEPDLVLSPGMYAETTIQLQQKNDALILPAQAVVQNGDQTYVLVVNAANQVEKRSVTLGIQTANQDEIASGLQEGERVIASGQTNYQAGETVSPHAAFIPTAAQEVGQ